jgi:hypothetical protein
MSRRRGVAPHEQQTVGIPCLYGQSGQNLRAADACAELLFSR